VEGASPAQGIHQDPGLIRQRVQRNPFDPAAHLSGRSPGKRQEHHAARIGALRDQMRDAMRKRIRLTGSRTRDDEKRRCVPRTVLDGTALFRIERGEVGRGHVAEGVESATPPASTAFRLSANKAGGQAAIAELATHISGDAAAAKPT
jgi:hypothetical protein